MTIPVWPTDLPAQTMVNGLQASTRGNRLTTSTDTGPGKQRKRGPSLRPVSCSIMVDPNLRALFDVFYEEELSFGVTPFLFPDQNLDGLALTDDAGAVLQDESGNPLLIESWWLVQFAQKQPATTAVSDSLYTIAFDLVVLP